MQVLSKRKITTVLLFAIMLMASFLAGCGSDQESSEYIGTWKCTTASVDETEIEAKAVIGDYTIEFGEGGKATVDYQGSEQEGEWESADSGVKVTRGDTTLEFKDKDGKLVVESDGLEMVFEKE